MHCLKVQILDEKYSEILLRQQVKIASVLLPDNWAKFYRMSYLLSGSFGKILSQWTQSRLAEKDK